MSTLTVGTCVGTSLAQREQQFATDSCWQHWMQQPTWREHAALDEPLVWLAAFVDWGKVFSDHSRVACWVLHVLVHKRVQAADVNVSDQLTLCGLVIQLCSVGPA